MIAHLLLRGACRYGSEDCLAASVRLGGSGGAGLREVLSPEALWNDLGCSAVLPFVCQRKSGSGAWNDIMPVSPASPAS